MQEQIYIVENLSSFNLKHIFECGQCFRWKKQQEDDSYIGVFRNNVLEIKQESDKITFKGICQNDIKKEVNQYFDLGRDYEKIKQNLSKIDNMLQTSIAYGKRN